MQHASISVVRIKNILDKLQELDGEVLEKLCDIRVCCNRSLQSNGIQTYGVGHGTGYLMPSIGFYEIMNMVLEIGGYELERVEQDKKFVINVVKRKVKNGLLLKTC